MLHKELREEEKSVQFTVRPPHEEAALLEALKSVESVPKFIQ